MIITRVDSWAASLSEAVVVIINILIVIMVLLTQVLKLIIVLITRIRQAIIVSVTRIINQVLSEKTLISFANHNNEINHRLTN